MRWLLRDLRPAVALIAVLAGCSAQVEQEARPSAQSAASSYSPAGASPVTQPSSTEAANASRRCAEYGKKLKEAERRLAKLKRVDRPPPADGYDFTEDYNQEVAIAEQEVEFYLGMLSDECAGEPQYRQPDEPTYEPDPPDEPEPDYGP